MDIRVAFLLTEKIVGFMSFFRTHKFDLENYTSLTYLMLMKFVVLMLFFY